MVEPTPDEMDEDGSWKEYRRLLGYQIKELRNRQEELHEEMEALRNERQKTSISAEDVEKFRDMIREWETYTAVFVFLRRLAISIGVVAVGIWGARELIWRLGEGIYKAFTP